MSLPLCHKCILVRIHRRRRRYKLGYRMVVASEITIMYMTVIYDNNHFGNCVTINQNDNGLFISFELMVAP